VITRLVCFVGLVVFLGGGCGITALPKNACQVETDCNPGHVCSHSICVAPDAAVADTDGPGAGTREVGTGNVPDAGPDGGGGAGGAGGGGGAGGAGGGDGSPSVADLCAQASGAIIKFTSAVTVMDMLVGRWAYCTGGATIFTMGVEFTADRHWYPLIAGPSGGLVRKQPDIGAPGTYSVTLGWSGAPPGGDSLYLTNGDGTGGDYARGLRITEPPERISFDYAYFVPIP
jgi:hypothetical protein